jgi:hypothetical protein
MEQTEEEKKKKEAKLQKEEDDSRVWAEKTKVQQDHHAKLMGMRDQEQTASES